MVDISNKALAMVLVAAIVISLGGTMVSLNKLDTGLITARAVDSGATNITISSDISVLFTTSLVDFGVGYANDTTGGTDYCTFDTNGSNNPSTPACANASGDGLGFNVVTPLVIENIGNVAAELNLSFDFDNVSFIGGTAPGFAFAVNETEASSCTGITPVDWTAMINTTVCTTFDYQANSDELRVHFNLSIPDDATAGSRNMTVTATLLS